MKFLISFLIFLLMSGGNVFAVGGDIGGGGSLKEMRAAFKLQNSKLDLLSKIQKLQNIDAAYLKWIGTLSPTERQLLLEKVFEMHIVQQINK